MSTDQTTVVPVSTEQISVAAKPASAQLITNVLSLSECMAMVKKDKLVGGEPIPDYLLEDKAEGLDMIGGMVKPMRLRVVQSLSKELKAAGNFSDGDAVVTPINVKVGDKANPIDAIVLLAWADYLCLNPRGAGLFWIRSSSTDIRSMEAQKARKMVKEPLPEGTIDPKTKQVYQIEYVKACNVLMFLPQHGITVLATWMKGEAKYGEAFSTLMMARGLSPYASMYQLSVCQRTNSRNESWDGLNAANSPTNRGFCPQEILPAMRGMHLHYRAQFEAANIDAGYDDMTDSVDPQKVDTSEY